MRMGAAVGAPAAATGVALRLRGAPGEIPGTGARSRSSSSEDEWPARF